MDIREHRDEVVRENKVPSRHASTANEIRIVPVVLAGGVGSRLWPLSREQFPKQLIGVLGEESLLQTTVQRLHSLVGVRGRGERPIVVCGEDTRFVTVQQLQETGVDAHIVVEPVRRDTAPALTLAVLAATRANDDAVIVAMPADHAIGDERAFLDAIQKAIDFAIDGAIVTLGVLPTRADAGFGYIKLGDPLRDGAHCIERFVEKPNAAVAETYWTSGQYWWNSGIFVVRASVWLDALQTLQPAMLEACVSAYANGSVNASLSIPDAVCFGEVCAKSIDYAVMERLGEPGLLRESVVVPLDAGWSDLGSWEAVWDALDKDPDGNVTSGRVVLAGTTSSLAHSEGRLIACVGVNNLVVVETPDAVLVADRGRVQEVKELVQVIRSQRAPEADAHRKVQRPWGYYDSIDQGARFQVKRIVVAPGASLSLQLHHHRAEHWIVVSGTARVTRGTEQFLLGENESTYIPLGTTHRLENPGRLPLELIEVQSGTYLGEDDIVRLDDTYGRA
ncbi:mannose-1-phosphate guanylyltransferase/mannose-6-phosphate isomerase [Paraburkholderia bannensis]|uniref:mannose-1-phosphate guanylyltransferase/mannose-6-phosphate isomerase n=1 Tax=Paraburkholderia bannensis TaxID=765414 RepID=UPI002AC369D6|nr:mannose-1-phosphate guanylyltransferase/mannose-6-phosphate isomerase [Paraburkholderia bannensis]